MNITIKTIVLVTLLTFTLAGCGYKAYLGLHGNSIYLHPDIHDGVADDDQQCLECHSPENADEGPVSPHPSFTGCFKCHSDEI